MAGSADIPPLVARTRAAFAARFGAAPTAIATAPGRANLIGEHVDYCDGLVLPFAIDARTAAAVRAHAGPLCRIAAAQQRGEAAFAIGRVPDDAPAWSRYVAGVAACLADAGVAFPAFDAWIDSDVPIGAGLSSSAALEVAVATALLALAGAAMDPLDVARLCQRAEHVHAGVPCGLMDQAASVLGRRDCAILLDCRTLAHEHLPLPLGDEVELLVADSGVQHALGATAYPQRRAACHAAAAALGVPALRDATEDDLARLPEALRPEATHVVREIGRVRRAADALRARDWPALGALLTESHASLRDLYRVTCPETDALVAHLVAQPGVLGARQVGGGFGGSVIVLLRRDVAATMLVSMGGAAVRVTAAAGVDCTTT